MINKININIFGILVVYLFISIFAYLTVEALASYVDNISHIQWSISAILIIWLCHYIVSESGNSFITFIGKYPQKNDIKIFLGLILTSLLIGIGSAALLIYIEATINIDFAINKWTFVTQESFENAIWGSYWLTVTLLNAMIIVPISEELIFRGLILNRLNDMHNTVFAIIVSSFIFAAFHFDKSYIGAFFQGIILAIVVLKYGSLYYSIIIHGAFNGLAYFVKIFYGVLFVIDKEKINQFQYWIPEFLCLLAGISLSIFYYNKLYRNNNSS